MDDIYAILKKIMGKWFSIISIFMLLVLFGCGGEGGPKGVQNRATLTWDPPTTKVDGTELLDLAGYKIYYGTSSGNYTETTNLMKDTTMYVIDNLSPNTYYFAVTAYDEMGNESDYLNEVSKTIL